MSSQHLEIRKKLLKGERIELNIKVNSTNEIF